MAPVAGPGTAAPLGVGYDGQGVNFAVFSDVAVYGGAVQLCLLDGAGGETRVDLWVDDDIWHAYVPGVQPGQRYGYRVDGPHDPARGVLYDATQVMVDPYAKAFEPVAGRPRQVHSLVADTSFDWSADRPPRTPWNQTIVYEAHVKGITARHPDVPQAQRGTFAGLSHPSVISHLSGLGVTAVELMPVHQFLTEQFLLERGLTDYWGYSTIGFFAPHAQYSAAGTLGQQVAEFKAMVKTLHAAGLEVYLDVVYNHTAEGPSGAPALSFRGLANATYYRLDPADPSRYLDVTGTGNSLASGAREMLRLVLDSLRYWVTDMHVDGFRFDLAAELARQHDSFDQVSAFFDLLYQDPVLSQVKLIAEPWDLAQPDGYEVGRFPAGWAEWNDHFRDQVRDFWGRRGGVGNMGYRLTGSSDLYASRRGPDASLNFVVAHDGKTLADLVTYENKYNQANGENNHDGTNDDHAFNCGVEGPTDDPAILALRRRERRNLLATLLISAGVPMLCGGDEIGRTQRGNNNAYCQDNDTSWYDWTPGDDARNLSAFVQRAAGLRKVHSVLRHRKFLTGAGTPEPDVTWLDLSEQPMTGGRWQDPGVHGIALVLAGAHADDRAADGSTVLDDDVLIVLNAGASAAQFIAPGDAGRTWTVVLDTTQEDGGSSATLGAGGTLAVGPATVMMATSPRVG